MENFARVVFTIVFITILAGVIVAFGLFAVAPAEKVVRVFQGGATSSDSGTAEVPVREGPLPPGGLTLEEVREYIQSQLPPRPVTPPPTDSSSPASSGPAIPGNYRPNPLVSIPIAPSEIPSGFLLLAVDAEGYSPKAFEVRPGAQVNLAIVSRDNESHLFVFQHSALSDIAVGIGPQQVRTLTFTAPTIAGEFRFQCGVPGHAAGGETGTMVVK